MNLVEQLEMAIEVALKAHRGIKDKGGNPYILHPLRMAMIHLPNILMEYPIFRGGSEEKVRIVLLLHDVVEDTKDQPQPVTLKCLLDMGFDQEIVDGVDGMTRRPEETYKDSIRRACKHPLSRCGKACDLSDNMDLSRVVNCSVEVRKEARTRVDTRYKPAFKVVVGESMEEVADFVTPLVGTTEVPLMTVDQVEEMIGMFGLNIQNLSQPEQQAIRRAVSEKVSIIGETAGRSTKMVVKALMGLPNQAEPPIKVALFTSTRIARKRLENQYETAVRLPHLVKVDEAEECDILILFDAPMFKSYDLMKVLMTHTFKHLVLVGDIYQISFDDHVNLAELVTRCNVPNTILDR